MRKAIAGIHASPRGHWVGDGFPVRSLFSYDGLGATLSPFLLLDYAGPAHFAPASRPRGVGTHPHRGFETVTIVYEGEVAHRDSVGNAGLIGAGDVQWMTAAAGILHQEYHSPAFTARGGALELVQLWVNLPAAHKMSPPRYQTLRDAEIARVELANAAGEVRVIAGEYAGRRGPAVTVTPLNVWDVRLRQDRTTTLTVTPGHTAVLAMLRGAVRVNGAPDSRDADLVVLERDGDDICLEAQAEATCLVLTGEPIDEPVVAYGPFVMNTREQIETALRDFDT